MAPEALWAKMVWCRPLFGLFVLSLVWTASIFLAPMTLPPGTFAMTTGRANVVDHWDIWMRPEVNWFARVVYVLGDAECHQLWYRSFWINGNQMPVDARDTSLFLFGTLGLFWAMLAPAAGTASKGVANAFPPRVRRWAERLGFVWFTAVFVFLALFPLALDGFTQLFGWRESTNLLRVLTGIPAGLVLGLVFGQVLKAVKRTSEGP
ncbi:MAG TPA: DUF2085 domain-containing protein [Thermoplasmata archaeon]|nr:DUF2085 domain-containing protein [Thermoplasmata archaeon]